MQIVFKNEAERSYGRRTGAVGFVICVGRVSRCVEGEHDGGVRVRGDRI